jgi:hypothetical protein
MANWQKRPKGHSLSSYYSFLAEILFYFVRSFGRDLERLDIDPHAAS